MQWSRIVYSAGPVGRLTRWRPPHTHRPVRDREGMGEGGGEKGQNCRSTFKHFHGIEKQVQDEIEGNFYITKDEDRYPQMNCDLVRRENGELVIVSWHVT